MTGASDEALGAASLLASGVLPFFLSEISVLPNLVKVKCTDGGEVVEMEAGGEETTGATSSRLNRLPSR